jgi:hypothetical protein
MFGNEQIERIVPLELMQNLLLLTLEIISVFSL